MAAVGIELKVVNHKTLPGKKVVECWRDGVFVAAIYPHLDGVRIVSKYMADVYKEKRSVFHAGQWVPSAIIKLDKIAE